ncbi:hypothetical protein [Catellatospora sp. NPDC049609]|uniref:hypothetical protein n=1 Tax=Catellatospora sp. NPDC049609 TaxID=3155505 RepID=UPI00341BC579
MTEDRWWQREIVTDELDECCDAIAAGLGIARSAVGTKGDEDHRRGHHRSQEWILNSQWCTNRSYTVQSGLTADQARHIAAIDITPGVWGTADNRRKVAAITARIIAAMKSGELDFVFEVYGAAADLTTVTGYNNRENRAATANSSHLDHVHAGIDRRKLRDRAALARLASIVIGDDMSETTQDEVHDQHTFVFYGGDRSSGKVVLPEYRDTTPLAGRVRAGNSEVEQLAEVRGELAKTLAAATKLVAASEAEKVRDAVHLAAIQALGAAGGADVAPVMTKLAAMEADLARQIGELRANLAAAEARAAAAVEREEHLREQLAKAYAAATPS